MTETQTIDFDALAETQRAELDELQTRRQALALDAVTDDGKRAELDDVESQLGAAQRELERIEAARIEHAQRETARAAREELERRQRLLQEVRDLNEPRRLAARKTDRALAVFIKALVGYRDLGRDQQLLLKEACGFDYLAAHATVERWHLEGALAAAIPQEDPTLWRVFSDLAPASVIHDRRQGFADSCAAVEPPSEPGSEAA